jgi:hypothetical protein
LLNEVFFHISSGWAKIISHTEYQLPLLPRTAQIVMIPVVVWDSVVLVNITDNNTPQVDFVLG